MSYPLCSKQASLSGRSSRGRGRATLILLPFIPSHFSRTFTFPFVVHNAAAPLSVFAAVCRWCKKPSCCKRRSDITWTGQLNGIMRSVLLSDSVVHFGPVGGQGETGHELCSRTRTLLTDSAHGGLCPQPDVPRLSCLGFLPVVFRPRVERGRRLPAEYGVH